MSEPLTRHYRRPAQMAQQGVWHIRCDCGWAGQISAFAGARVLKAQEVEDQLEKLFVDHLPADKRRLYIMVDQRQDSIAEVEREAGKVELVCCANGNWLMPEGVQCVLTSHFEADGIRYGNYLVPDTGETGRLPIGEIRTADGRVFRYDGPA